MRTGVVFGAILALAAVAFVRSEPAPTVDTSLLPQPVVTAADNETELFLNVEHVVKDNRYVAWTSSIGLQTCLHTAITTGNTARIRDSAPADITLGSVCGPPRTRPTDSLTLAQPAADPENHHGIIVLWGSEEPPGSQWTITTNPAPTHIDARSPIAVIEYHDTDYQQAAAAGNIHIRCSCGDITVNPGFNQP